MDALVTVDEKLEPIRVTDVSQLRSTLHNAANDARARGLLNVAFSRFRRAMLWALCWAATIPR